MIRYSKPFRLSSAGSTRATAYVFSNKSVTLEGRTHVVWLDAIARVRGRTYDHASRSWSETFDLFEGCDNHTTPALTVDARGRVHILFGPHGWWGEWNQARFMHAVAKEPNSISAWEEPDSFGYGATYGSISHMPCGLDAAVYRGGEAPWALMFQRQRDRGGWTHAMPLMWQDIRPQYTHVGGHILCGPDGTLYVGGHFYSSDAAVSIGVCLLVSRDMGRSWTSIAGQPAETPICYEERFAIPHQQRNPYFCGMALDRSGALWVLASQPGLADRSVLLSRWTGAGWNTRDLAAFLPRDWIADACTMTIDTADRIHVLASAVPEGTDEDEDRLWGHPAHEVFHLCSRDGGGTFECNMVSEPDGSVANWLPAISLQGVYHPVERPVLLYTRGVPGDGCKPDTRTEVYCVMIEALS
jgi:hypothetical protein